MKSKKREGILSSQDYMNEPAIVNIKHTFHDIKQYCHKKSGSNNFYRECLCVFNKRLHLILQQKAFL